MAASEFKLDNASTLTNSGDIRFEGGVVNGSHITGNARIDNTGKIWGRFGNGKITPHVVNTGQIVIDNPNELEFLAATPAYANDHPNSLRNSGGVITLHNGTTLTATNGLWGSGGSIVCADNTSARSITGDMYCDGMTIVLSEVTATAGRNSLTTVGDVTLNDCAIYVTLNYTNSKADYWIADSFTLTYINTINVHEVGVPPNPKTGNWWMVLQAPKAGQPLPETISGDITNFIADGNNGLTSRKGNQYIEIGFP